VVAGVRLRIVDEDLPPPVKRRYGVAKEEPTAVNEDTIHPDPLRQRGRSMTSSKASTGTNRAKTSVVVKDEEDEEAKKVSVLTRKSTKTPAPLKPKPSSVTVPSEKPKKHSAHSGKKLVVVSDDNSDIVEISAMKAVLSWSKTLPELAPASESSQGHPSRDTLTLAKEHDLESHTVEPIHQPQENPEAST